MACLTCCRIDLSRSQIDCISPTQLTVLSLATNRPVPVHTSGFRIAAPAVLYKEADTVQTSHADRTIGLCSAGHASVQIWQCGHDTSLKQIGLPSPSSKLVCHWLHMRTDPHAQCPPERRAQRHHADDGRTRRPQTSPADCGGTSRAAHAAGTGTGTTSQISSAYCRMVRSELKKPLPAVYRMERRVHSSWSLYSASTSSCTQRTRPATSAVGFLGFRAQGSGQHRAHSPVYPPSSPH